MTLIASVIDLLVILFSIINGEVYSSSVSLTVEGGVSLVGEHCPGTVRLFCEGVDLTLLEWKFYHDDNMYLLKRFDTDSVNETTKVFNDSTLVSASVELVELSQDKILRIFANFSSVLSLDISQIAIGVQKVFKIRCGDAQNFNETLVNISIVEETVPNVYNFSVSINTFILTVTWNQYAKCSQYQEEILYNVSLILFDGTNDNKIVNSSRVCTPTCSVSFEVLETGIYVVALQAKNNIGTSNITTYSSSIPAGAIVCDTPSTLINGSFTILSTESDFTEGSEIVLQCDNGLLPSHPRTAMCIKVSGRGEWVPNPADLLCEEEKCSALPKRLTNNLLLKYSYTSTGENLTITFWCEEGYKLIGPHFIACNSMYQWSSDLEDLNCLGQANSRVLIQSILGSAGGIVVAIIVVILLIVLLKMRSKNFRIKKKRTKTQPSDEPEVDGNPYDNHSVSYAMVDIEASESRAVLVLEERVTEADKLLNLDQSLLQLKTVQIKWKEIGFALSIPTAHIEQVEERCKDNSSAGLKEMIDFWMRNCSGRPTWIVLANALKLVGEEELARQFLEVYETGRLPVVNEPTFDQLRHFPQIPVNSTTATTKFESEYDRIFIPRSQTQGPVYSEVSTLPSQSTGYLLDPKIVDYTTVDFEATKSRARAMPKPKPVQKTAAKGIEADKLVDLDRVLVQLKSVQGKWREIGKALNVPETHIEQVEPYCAGNDVQGITEVIDFWIRNCDGKPTWRELGNALKSVGQEQLANLLMEVYETGCLPIELNFDDIPDCMYKHGASVPPPIPTRSVCSKPAEVYPDQLAGLPLECENTPVLLDPS
ncbi:uncharacterized protein LOC135351151 isoform X2 [Halichondria panicea]|uniref:uncharacterized protein LOC135351151 isoform X2 n=1 Tax=Halichondria panicea TaxID=6063 RepID=UPI00312B57FB